MDWEECFGSGNQTCNKAAIIYVKFHLKVQ